MNPTDNRGGNCLNTASTSHPSCCKSQLTPHQVIDLSRIYSTSMLEYAPMQRDLHPVSYRVKPEPSDNGHPSNSGRRRMTKKDKGGGLRKEFVSVFSHSFFRIASDPCLDRNLEVREQEIYRKTGEEFLTTQERLSRRDHNFRVDESAPPRLFPPR